jgi:hypothetical protein
MGIGAGKEEKLEKSRLQRIDGGEFKSPAL